MLAAARRDLLVERLRRDGRLVAKDLASELGLSEDSIRRDLRDLAAAGLCQRVYGGALPASPAVADHDARRSIATAGKERVGRRAAGMVRPGSTVFVDGGTTALALVAALPPDLQATVVTHSPVVAVALAEHTAVEVLLVGGRLFRHSMVTGGASAVEALDGVACEQFFLGVTGVHAQAGLTTGVAEDAAMKRAIARRCAETHVLASHEKVGAASAFTVLPLGEATSVITDADPGAPAVRDLLAVDVPLVLV